MYIPPINIMRNNDEIIEFMRRFSFITMITSEDDTPIGTHLPILVRVENDRIILSGHIAKQNNQWKDIENNTVLIIFTEPHSYISPKLYEKEINVPTWNYMAVHVYGKATIIHDMDSVIELLEHTIENYEPSYKSQWDSLTESYKLSLAKEIIAFSISVEDIQAKKKLSQNKTRNERNTIISSLSNSSNTNEQLIAEYMQKL